MKSQLLFVLGLLFFIANERQSVAEVLDPPPTRSTNLRPPRDGNVAIREELDSARRAQSLAAYDLFLARHPDHPLAGAARRERAALVARGGK